MILIFAEFFINLRIKWMYSGLLKNVLLLLLCALKKFFAPRKTFILEHVFSSWISHLHCKIVTLLCAESQRIYVKTGYTQICLTILPLFGKYWPVLGIDLALSFCFCCFGKIFTYFCYVQGFLFAPKNIILTLFFNLLLLNLPNRFGKFRTLWFLT